MASHPIYGFFFSHVFSRLDPEVAHHRAAAAIGLAGRIAPIRGLLRATFGRTGHGTYHLFGRELSSPLGVAAGFDKEARMVRGLIALGYSHVEIGTVTAHPQPGNAKPRLWRRIPERALVNRMGFNNSGSAALAARLKKLRATSSGAAAVIGVNIGKTKATPLENAAQDYAVSARTLAPYADYLVINVSSPNTPGLRTLQAGSDLRPIVEATTKAASEATRRAVPVLVKIAPDLSDADVVTVCDLVTELDLAGVVATNTTIAHDGPTGGLSGPPLLPRAREVVALVRSTLGPDKTVIGVGGISSAEDARTLLEAGADAVQAYTAFIYSGPAWPGGVARGLNRS